MKSNYESVLTELVKHSGLRISKEAIHQFVFAHPQRSSLVVISDALDYWSIDHLVARLSLSELQEQVPPFLTLTRGGQLLFVTGLSEEHVDFIAENGKAKRQGIPHFQEQYDGVSILIKTNENSGELGYEKRRKPRVTDFLLAVLAIVALLSLIPLSYESWSVPWNLRSYLSLAVAMVGTIILSTQVLKELALARTILPLGCDLKKDSGCRSLANSERAYFYGWVKWLDLGVIYFMSKLLSFISMPDMAQAVSSYLSLVVVLFVPYSLFIQFKFFRKPCMLCLSVLFLFVLEACFVELNGYDISLLAVGKVLVIYLTVAFIYLSAKRLYLLKSELRAVSNSQLKLKRRKEVFKVLNHELVEFSGNPGYPLCLNRQMEDPHLELMIFLSLECEACKSVFEDLMLIHRRKQWKVNVYFSEKDFDKPVFKQFISKFLSQGQEKALSYLEEAFRGTGKNQEKISPDEPIDRESLELVQRQSVVAFKECKVKRTPEVVANKRRISNHYRLRDLVFFEKYRVF